MSNRPTRLSGRTAAVFRQFLGDREDSLHPEDRAAAERFWDEIGQLKPPAIELNRRSVRSYRWLAAAVAAFLVLALPTILWMRAPQPSAGTDYATAQAEIRSLALVDGSQVQLGAKSEMLLRFNSDERRVRLLAGEAIFKVSHDAERPFIVETSAGEVRALGTAFMVRVGAGSARLVVIEGTVRVTPGGPEETGHRVSRVADAGEMVSFGANAADSNGTTQAFVTAQGSADVDRSTAWTRGMLYFNGEPLGEVLTVVNRYADRPVTLRDPELASTPVYAAMRVGDTSAIEAVMAHP